MSDDDGETYCDQKPIFLHHHGGWCWLRSPGCQASGWSISNSPLCDDYRNNNVNLVEKLFPTIEFRFQISHYITIDNGHHDHYCDLPTAGPSPSCCTTSAATPAPPTGRAPSPPSPGTGPAPSAPWPAGAPSTWAMSARWTERCL